MKEYFASCCHPRWRGQWDDLTDEARGLLTKGVLEVLAAFPVEISKNIIDVQLVGGRILGSSKPAFSDFDIIFVSDPELEQSIRDFPDAREKLAEVSQRLEVKLEASLSKDSRWFICYSFLRDEYYGKKRGEVINKRLRRNWETKEFEIYEVDALEKRAGGKTTRDPWGLINTEIKRRG